MTTNLRTWITLAGVSTAIAAFAVCLTTRSLGREPLVEQAESAAETTTLIPQKHTELREKLVKKSQFEFKNIAARDVLKSLSEKIGEPVYLHESADPHLLDYKVTIKPIVPVSSFAAIQMLTAHFSPFDFGIIFEKGVCIASAQNVPDRFLLRTYDFSYFSDYTTAKRKRLIAQIRTEIAPESWLQNEGPWILPSRNVFAIDVYHTPAVHKQIANLRNLQYAYLSTETEAQKLQQSLFQAIEKKDSEKASEIIRELQKLFAYKSLESRLKYEEATNIPEPELTTDAAGRLAERDQRDSAVLAKHLPWSKYRAESLRMLHEDQVQDFIRREGFGKSRMPKPGPSFVPLTPLPRLELASAEIITATREIPTRVPKTDSERASSGVALPTEKTLTAFHQQSEDTFLEPNRFGYVKDREHVAGFASHAFVRAPSFHSVNGQPGYSEPTEQWALHRLELVSLLKHEKPAVYISAELPRLDEADEAKTRELNEFESPALARLVKGEDIVARPTTNRIEMVGSLRASKQCMECHDVKHGQLLGAFSYQLLRDPPLTPEQALASPNGE